MRKSVILALMLGFAGVTCPVAHAQTTTGQPQMLTPVKPIPAKPSGQTAAMPAPVPVQVPVATPSPAANAKPSPAPAQPAPAAATPAAQTAVKGAATPTPAAPAPARMAESPSCLTEIDRAEKRYRLPDGLLVSIALAESGRRDPDTGILAPWPWTINSHGTGEYFDTVEAATARTAALLAGNDGLVDVGCMQVDLYHHPHAFQTLLAAFDPETNVDYAARFLLDLKSRNGSWAAAIAAYNAGDPHLGAEYVARVLYYWKGLGTTAARAQVAAEKPNVRGFVIDTRPAPLEIAADFFEKKDYSAAVTIYRAVLDADPDDQTAMLGLAETLRATGRSDEARQQLERLLTESPGNRSALATLLSIIDELPPPQRLGALLSARQVVPGSAQIPARLAMIEEGRGNLKEAVAQMGGAIRLAPTDPILRLDYALMLDKGGYRSASIEAYAQFLELYRPNTVALTVPIEQIRQRLNYLRSHSP